MYGLVNKALEGMIRSNWGDANWEKIKDAAGVDIAAFVSMTPYPDDVTYRLVGSAAAQLNMPVSRILHDFGEYWVLYTAQEGYGSLMKMAGSTLRDFLMNLDSLHSRVGTIFPELKPPSFRCTDVNDVSLVLHYYSSRAGLAPMVIGLVTGLAGMLGTTAEILHTRDKAQGADHDEFLVRYGNQT